MATLPLQGRNALVTGASSGIGLACARAFAQQGARVMLTARRGELLGKIADELPGSLAMACDVADEGSVNEAVDKALSEFGHLDYVIHAAGIITPSPIETLTADLWRQHIDVNLSGAFYVMRRAALAMKERGSGSIVAIASDLSINGLANYAHYCASKAGLVGLAKAFALELAPHVRVNCVCPGPVDTPMMESEIQWFGGSDKVRQEAIDQVPLKRFASPEEIAKFAVFVATEMTFATGSVLSIDGGTTAR